MSNHHHHKIVPCQCSHSSYRRSSSKRRRNDGIYDYHLQYDLNEYGSNLNTGPCVLAQHIKRVKRYLLHVQVAKMLLLRCRPRKPRSQIREGSLHNSKSECLPKMKPCIVAGIATYD